MSRERAYQKILSHLLAHFEKVEHFDGKQFGDSLPQELLPSFNTSTLFPIPHFEDEEKLLIEVEKVSAQLKKFYVQKKMKELAEEIKTASASATESDASRIDELRKKYSQLASQLESN